MAARAESKQIPTVGVLCIDIASKLIEIYPDEAHYSYIAASYVKCLESAGAFVVPIWIGRKLDYYKAILSQVNGVLLPGGAVCLDEEEAKQYPNLTNDCVAAARIIYELVMERNAAGEYFPLYGTCLGFQLIMINAAKDKEVRTKCFKSKFKALPLHLSKNYEESVLFKELPEELAKEMSSQPFACHQHAYCITESDLHRFKLHEDWHVLATQQDDEGEEGRGFITLIEHRKFPIFGSQFHPERAAYEQLLVSTDTCREAHTSICIELAQYFARTFVNACRRNNNNFASVELLTRHLICNWQPIFTGKFPKSHWLQCYMFDKHVDYPAE
ncbi:gamma-glutamyl hydrolase isoform X2 [Drosophila innubila]|uniref:gamma-glutamyl hydrolase isoform X2 n=1 Tax=Drosophila innubila TaxID=198719 RepID=UPI00148C5774|nr:gamma-glutamyl hydrolase isoform X2 [Drosophila innubila]